MDEGRDWFPKVGDRVWIVRKVPSHSGGWTDWVEGMDDVVGCIGEVFLVNRGDNRVHVTVGTPEYVFIKNFPNFAIAPEGMTDSPAIERWREVRAGHPAARYEMRPMISLDDLYAAKAARRPPGGPQYMAIGEET